jgi:hypothetical protein
MAKHPIDNRVVTPFARRGGVREPHKMGTFSTAPSEQSASVNYLPFMRLPSAGALQTNMGAIKSGREAYLIREFLGVHGLGTLLC